jgi:hypothetical protein
MNDEQFLVSVILLKIYNFNQHQNFTHEPYQKRRYPTRSI